MDMESGGGGGDGGVMVGEGVGWSASYYGEPSTTAATCGSSEKCSTTLHRDPAQLFFKLFSP